ncbi:MAG TPA: response regulator, partial [Candidatus Binataceae bacterium]|nr:response regulator [Candidatus Binataceae bacterium]
MAPEKRILIAEDDASTRDAWNELVASWGYGVKAVPDGNQALAALKTFDPHIVLLDLMMPGKSGLEVLEAIRALGLDFISIVISGEGDIPEAVKAIQLGAYDFLRKPVAPEQLRVLLA